MSHKHAVEALAAVLQALEGLEENDQIWVIDSVSSRLGLSLKGATGRRRVDGADGTADQGGDSEDETEISPREFMKSKRPRNDVQRMACLAYYLHHHRGQHQFKTADLTALNTEAAGVRIGNPSQAVANATKQSHYLAMAGGGQKQITALGEEVVDALPDVEAVKAAELEHKPVRKKRKTKATGKAESSGK